MQYMFELSTVHVSVTDSKPPIKHRAQCNASVHSRVHRYLRSHNVSKSSCSRVYISFGWQSIMLNNLRSMHSTHGVLSSKLNKQPHGLPHLPLQQFKLNFIKTLQVPGGIEIQWNKAFISIFNRVCVTKTDRN